jgi:predicted dehydrogenase
MESKKKSSRRTFLKSSTGVAIGTLLRNETPLGFHAGGTDTLRVGLIGCGARGTGAAVQALRADKNVKLVAMGDVFEEYLRFSLLRLKDETAVAGKIDVPPERQFVGFNAYKKVIESGVDIVLLTAPPHFRPAHLEAAVEAGKHVFAEKPVAVDSPGVRSVLASCQKARKKNLSVVSGLCFRYNWGFRETIKRIQDGTLGQIHTLQANDFRGVVWFKTRQSGWSDMEWQLRNWYYYTWLSGDFVVEQHVHYLDICAWMMGNEYPVRAVGTGGRIVRTGPEYGNVYDHHAVIYEYPNGTKIFGFCRQHGGCANDISAHATGSHGRAVVSEKRLAISNRSEWAYEGRKNNHFQSEHDELFASIRNGTPINNGDYMANSTLLAIMGRMATYSGQAVTWDEALNSKEEFTPPKYEWCSLPEPILAIPGTRFKVD